MFTNRFCLRSRPGLKTAVSGLCLLSLLLFLAACSAQSATVAEPTVVEPTLPPPTETAVPPTSEPTEVPVPTQVPLTSPLAEKMDAWLARKTETSAFKGAVLVARGDEIVLDRGYGLADEENDIPNTPATKFRIASITKPFTAVAIMQLQEQDLLDVNDPICSYLEDCPVAWADITIHHLLSHTSGIPNYRWQAGYETIKATPMPPNQLLAEVKSRPLNFEAGEGFEYTDSGYVLLGQIIERVSGQPYAEFLKENILDPLGMADTGLDEAPDGLALGYAYSTGLADPIAIQNLYAAGGMYSTVGDLYRFVRALDTEQLVSQETLDLVFTQHALMDPSAGENSPGYGYAWILGNLNGHPSIGHAGLIEGVSTDLVRYPEDDLIIIVLSNQENADVPGFDSPGIEPVLARMVFDES